MLGESKSKWISAPAFGVISESTMDSRPLNWYLLSPMILYTLPFSETHSVPLKVVLPSLIFSAFTISDSVLGKARSPAMEKPLQPMMVNASRMIVSFCVLQ